MQVHILGVKTRLAMHLGTRRMAWANWSDMQEERDVTRQSEDRE